MFYEFDVEDKEKEFPRANKRTPIDKDNTNSGKQIKSVMKRYTEKS